MPFLIVAGVALAYGGIGLAVRNKFFPREPVKMALAWPIVLGMGKK